MRKVIFLMITVALSMFLFSSCNTIEPEVDSNLYSSLTPRDSTSAYKFAIVTEREGSEYTIKIMNLKNTVIPAVQDVSLSIGNQKVNLTLVNSPSSPFPYDGYSYYRGTYDFYNGRSYNVSLKILHYEYSTSIVIPSFLIFTYYTAGIYFDPSQELVIAWERIEKKVSDLQVARISWRSTNPYGTVSLPYMKQPTDVMHAFEANTVKSSDGACRIEVENLNYTIKEKDDLDRNFPVVFLNFSSVIHEYGLSRSEPLPRANTQQRVLETIQLIR
jgi:hypothetical protein